MQNEFGPSTELSNWEKLHVLAWKNFCVALQSYRRVLASIIVPPTFCLILIMLRFLITVDFRPEKVFRPMLPNRTWMNLMDEIETRREKIRNVSPEFTHNTYVPQQVLIYTPNSSEYYNILKKAVFNELSNIRLQSAPSCASLKRTMAADHLFAGICFSVYDFSILKFLEFEIVYPSELRIYNDSYIGADWNTNNLYDTFSTYEKRQMFSHDGGYVGYIREGFAAIQNAVSMAFIQITYGIDNSSPHIRRFPTKAHVDDPLTGNIKITISLILVCGYLFPVCNLTGVEVEKVKCVYYELNLTDAQMAANSYYYYFQNIVRDKETQVRKILKLMGISNWINFFAWFVEGILTMGLSSFIIIVLLKIEWSEGRSVLTRTSPLALLICLLSHNTAAVSFCLLMSSLFSDTKIAVPLTGLTWLCTYLPYIASSMNNDWLVYLRPLMCCFCNTVLGLIFDHVIEFEKFSDGFNFGNMLNTKTVDDYLSSGFYIAMLFVLSIGYILVALYVEELNPGTFEIGQRWNFLCRQRHTTFRDSFRRMHAANIRMTRVYEIEPEYKKIALKVENLSKVYNDIPAVKHVNMNFFEGEITVIMGHNGAGKTTLLQMIAGMVAPTSGKVVIEGLDSRKYRNLARKNIGVCMHEGLLFPELNIVDQLTLFSRLRGLTGMDLETDVNKYLQAMNVLDRQNYSTSSLSHGERRFLSVCCALAGKCNIILLDEPSKGLDMFARKSLWELLRNERKRRTILIATNSEEETEALADRVAFLSSAELKCYGSTFFLKKIYGQGHRLVFFKGRNFVTDHVTALIQEYFPNTTPECEIGSQVSYILEDLRSNTQLLDLLEGKADELHIEGITVAELDSADIFVRMGAEDPSGGDRVRHVQIMSGQSIYTSEYELLRFVEDTDRLTGFQLLLNHCEVMMSKRILSSLRTTLLGLLQLFMPILFAVVSFSLLNYEHERDQLKPLNFDFLKYPESITVFDAHRDIHMNPEHVSIYEAYSELLFWLGLQHKVEEVPITVSGVSSYILDKQRTITDVTNNKYLVGASFGKDNMNAYFNNYPLHTVPLSLNLMHNAIFRGLVQTSGKIGTRISTLPYTSRHHVLLKDIPASIGNYLAINVSFCVGFTWSLSVIFLVREREGNFKLLQFLSGAHGLTFWLNTFIFDFFVIVATTLIMLLTIVMFELETFMKEETSGSYFLILIIAGTCMCSANYLVSIIWSDAVFSYIAITTFNIFGTMCYWAYLEVYRKSFRNDDISDPYEIVTRIFPHFSLCNALVKVFDRAELSTVCSDSATYIASTVLENCKMEPNCCEEFTIWTFRGGVFADLIYIFIYGALCWILLFFHESYHSWLNLLQFKVPEDDEGVAFAEFEHRHSSDTTFFDRSVVDEEFRTTNRHAREYKNKILIADRIGYHVNNNQIIKRITFSVNYGECFSILGANGSGKSTLTQLLAGHLPMAFGNAYINGINMKGNPTRNKSFVSYCPQGDISLPEFDLFEIMRMICLLRAIPNHDIVDICENLAKILGFYQHLYKRMEICGTGIRRRFQCACALIGNPKLIFLDEPTAGIDIGGRRQLWNILCRLRALKHSIVLSSATTHDCESISDRVAILSKGRLLSISDPWYLSHKYAYGYLLKMKIKRITVRVPDTSADWIVPTYRTFSSNPFLKLATFIENEFPLSKVKDQLGNIVVYFIPYNSTTITNIFEVMQRNAFILYIEDFCIARTALATILMEAIEQERYSEQYNK